MGYKDKSGRRGTGVLEERGGKTRKIRNKCTCTRLEQQLLQRLVMIYRHTETDRVALCDNVHNRL